MKKTKVVCTMGPNTNDRELMRKLIQNGMDVARFNFSHGDHEEHKGRMDLLKQLREEEHANTAILLDTKGPEIRTGVLKDGKKVMLEAGQTFVLTTEQIEGDEKRVSISYEGLTEDVDAGIDYAVRAYLRARPYRHVVIYLGTVSDDAVPAYGHEVPDMDLLSDSGAPGYAAAAAVTPVRLFLPGHVGEQLREGVIGVLHPHESRGDRRLRHKIGIYQQDRSLAGIYIMFVLGICKKTELPRLAVFYLRER